MPGPGNDSHFKSEVFNYISQSENIFLIINSIYW